MDSLPGMTDAAIGKVREFEGRVLATPQLPVVTQHLIHGGVYARGMMVPKDTVLTGALIKVSTVLIVHGDAFVYIGDTSVRLTGHAVLPASAGRKQAFYAVADTYLTMLFPTSARTVEEAEREFTDEHEALLSRQDGNPNVVTITGE
jgi:hypothetical protein